MNNYTVIGLWLDNFQRFATIISAESPKNAEQMILKEYPELIVCGIILGNHHAIDTEF